jgi:hypothetical protein
MEINIGSILQRKGKKDILCEVVSILENGYTKMIRVDDYEHRMKKKQDLLDNEIFHMFYKVIQRKMLKRLDEEPQYFYVETKKLNVYFIKK